MSIDLVSALFRCHVSQPYSKGVNSMFSQDVQLTFHLSYCQEHSQCCWKHHRTCLENKRVNLLLCYTRNDNQGILYDAPASSCASVTPCLSNAPANCSISGFSSGRETTVRSGSGDALEFVAPIEAVVSEVRSNASSDPLSMVTTCSTVRARTKRSAFYEKHFYL